MIVQFKLRRTRFVPSAVLACVCAAWVVVARAQIVPIVVSVLGTSFSYTDFFFIIAAGIGGMGCGMLSFTIVFVAEILHANYDFSVLYSISTYMILLLLASGISYRRWYASAAKSALALAVFEAALVACWHLTFNFFGDLENFYTHLTVRELAASAFPECAAAVIFQCLFFRFAPDKAKLLFGSGWLYTSCFMSAERSGNGRKSILGRRMTALSLVEALILCLAAILFCDIQTCIIVNERFRFPMVLSMWRMNLHLFMLFMSAALPISYLFNFVFQRRVANPINAMSFVMERYFEGNETERVSALPDLGIRSGDEIEKLYASLSKMVGDMSRYFERILQQERKSVHLTQGFMLALAKAVDAKDHYTSGHSVRVAKYAQEIARRMGKSEKEQENIYTMGLLHDIGKIGVSEAIINKNGRLTDDEFAEIKTHPEKGWHILRNVTELPALATGARWHHERYDGRGYPDGLSGDEIPEEARIIAVADAYDAMTSKRAYSAVRPQEQVRAEIVRCSGTQFDPKMAEIMLAMIDDDTEYRMHEGGDAAFRLSSE